MATRAASGRGNNHAQVRYWVSVGVTSTSRGFGREWALAALERGDSVVATARNASSLDTLVAAHGDAVLPISLDVTDRDAVFAAVARAHGHFGRLDVVVNNAGMSASAASGKELVHSTYKYLGAQSVTRAVNGLPYVGNKLGCASCHMADGTQPHASPFVVVAQKYATPGIFNSRSNTFLDVPGRVNDCFERSLAGEPLPRDSKWMKDIVAYIDFLGTGIQPGYTATQVPGQGFPDVAKLTRAADPVRGLEIYKNSCTRCHQADGSGVRREDEKRYRYPALWGNNSFGLMSGTGRLSTTATLIHGTMPRDKVDPADPSTRMSQADASDVSAYILSKSHPLTDRFLNDWSGVGPGGMPNWLRRASSASYGLTMPRSDAGIATDDPTKPPMFTREQHTYGPFQPIEDALKAARIARGFP